MAEIAGIASALFDAWERRDFDAIVANMADDVVLQDQPRGESIKGRDDIKAFYASWAVACPDATCGYSVFAASGDAVAVEGVYAGTNTGPFGPFGPTGRSVSIPWINNIRFNAAGQIAGISVLYEQFTLLVQLGHIAPPGS
jgi:steroid delta-isomerase-like uncharacterized protein